LELVQINVERTVETEGRGDGRDDLSDEAVEVREAGRNDTKLLLADIINGFVIDLNEVIRTETFLRDSKPENLP